jgi:cellulose synthase/poly-beta-1,6-N-acetylglucosamine synthase-like glycosyltransferase
MIDADCRIAPGSLDHLAAACAMTGRPVQALDLMKAPDQSTINYQVAEFAWRVKNWVRPLGLLAVGLPCQLMGTGMAFPWKVIHAAKLASGQVVEDLNLGLELGSAGYLPLFCPSALVTSTFPTSPQAADRQRQRWEQGHVDLILAQTPHLLAAAIRRRSLGLFAMALDLAVPPLVLLGFLCAGVLVLSGLAALAGLSPIALYVSTASFVALLTAVFLSWVSFGRDILPLRSIWSLGPYALQKLRLYYRVSSGGRISQWNRTDRK